jgi:hypothetical protein
MLRRRRGNHWGEMYEFFTKYEATLFVCCVLLARRDDPIGCVHRAAIVAG